MGAFDFVEKPLSLDKTMLVVRNALRQRQLEAENRALRAHVDRRLVMVGESHSMRQLREQIAMAAPTNGRVLIYGENGTGKELVARSVHALSRRRSGPFVEVNCAAIPEELIESELFGHVKGAFTGAVSDRRGRFEAADGGTIFLDEIADMSLKTQAKVLRVLQEQVVDPVGGAASVRVDVRVLAATNKDLPTEIRAGRFREDLLLPPQRHPDVRAAAARSRRGRAAARGALHGASCRASTAAGRRRCDPGALAALRSYALAGQRARAAQRDRAPADHGARRRHLDRRTCRSSTASSGRRRASRRRTAPVLPLHEARERFERDYILRTLAAQQGNISRTAEVLGVERSNLYRKMRAFGIAPARRGGEPASSGRVRRDARRLTTRQPGCPPGSERAAGRTPRDGPRGSGLPCAVRRRRARPRPRSSSAARGTRPMISLSTIAAPARRAASVRPRGTPSAIDVVR